MQPDHTISACGKCILVGEHAVVYGTKAIAMPLPSLRITVTLFSKRETRPEHPQGIPTQIREIVPQVAAEACKLLQVERPKIAFDGHSTIPVGAGLGSSAALCVASIRSLAAYHHLDLSPEQVAQYANVLETRFHGNPSGLDATVVSYESCLRFSKSSRPERLALTNKHPLFHFILIDSVERSSTKNMVERAAPYFKGSDGERLLAKFEELTSDAGLALQERNEQALAQSMSANGHLLDQVGIVTPHMQQVITEMRRLGVLGVKPTGAGGGGMILGLAPAEKADEIWQQVTQTFEAKNCFLTVM